MKNTTMKINCWKLEDGNEVPMPSTATLDGFEWNGKFRITVTDDDGSLGLPFLFAANDTAILTVETSEQKGTHTGNKKIKQILRCVPRSLGEEVTCSRIRSHNGNEHVWSEWEQASSSTGTTVEWDSASCIDSFVTAGVYNITGERLSASDGLPIANSNPGHTIRARLTVLDSSIAGTGDSHDKCVTQVLTLSNRTGGDGDVYIRTGRASIKNQLAGGTGWKPWGKLQQNIEVGQVTSLDGYIDNGMYSGVYTDGTSFFQTFVMVVINNYAVAGKTGNVRSVSQFKYALNVDSTFSYKTRTGHGSTGISWGEWVDLGAATTTDIQDNSVTAQKLSSALQEQINKSANGVYWTSGPNAVTLNINKNDGTVGWQTLPAATEENAGVMTAEDKKELQDANLKLGFNAETIFLRQSDLLPMTWNGTKMVSSTAYNIWVLPLTEGRQYSTDGKAYFQSRRICSEYPALGTVVSMTGIPASTFTATSEMKYLVLTVTMSAYDGNDYVVEAGGLGLCERVNMIEQTQLPLLGKTIVCFGDSITEFDDDDHKGYGDYLAELSGATVIRGGIGGTQLATRKQPVEVIPDNEDDYKHAYGAVDISNLAKAWANNDWGIVDNAVAWLATNKNDNNSAVIDRLKNCPIESTDIVIVFGGTNDLNNSTYGKPTDTDAVGSVCGGINQIIDSILSVKPKMVIYFFTPIPRMATGEVWCDDYRTDQSDAHGCLSFPSLVKRIKECVEHNHIPCCDMYNTIGINRKNIYTYADDGVHPNHGYSMLANKMYSFIMANRNWQ